MAAPTTIASLAADLTARITRFQKGFRKAQAIATNFAKRMAKIGSIAVGATGVGTTFALGKIASAQDALIKLGRTAGLTGSQMAAFELLASRSGLALENLVAGTRRLTERTFEALVEKSDSVIGMFRELGITTSQLRAVQNDTRGQLLLIAEAFGNMEDGAMKSALAVRLLGDDGAKMLNAFTDGAKSFAQASKDATLFGLALAKGPQKSIETLEDRLGDLGQMIRGFANQIGAILAPAFAAIATEVVETLKRFILLRGGMTAIAVSVVERMFQIAEAGAKAVAWISGLIATLQSVGKSIADFVIPKIDFLIDAFRRLQAVGRGIANLVTLDLAEAGRAFKEVFAENVIERAPAAFAANMQARIDMLRKQTQEAARQQFRKSTTAEQRRQLQRGISGSRSMGGAAFGPRGELIRFEPKKLEGLQAEQNRILEMLLMKKPIAVLR